MTLELARAWRDDREPDWNFLAEPMNDMGQKLKKVPARDWNEVPMAWIFELVHLDLLRGDFAAAQSRFVPKKSFKDTPNYHAWLLGLIERLLASPDRTEALAWFAPMFEMIRNVDGSIKPDDGLLLDRSFHRLELALIRHCVLLGKPLAGQWRDVLAQIAA